MEIKKISSAGPSITQTEIALVTEAIKYGWGDKMSFYIDQFVNEFFAHMGVKLYV